MCTRLVQALRVRLFAYGVVCKIVFNHRTGKLRSIFRPDNEYIPIYSDDDFEDLIGAHFVKGVIFEREDGEEIPAIQKQSFTLDDSGMAYVEEAIYRESDLEILCKLQKKTALGLDFIPMQEFPVNYIISN